MAISRKPLVVVFGVALALLAGGFFMVRALDPDRRLERSWVGFIADIESRSALRTAGWLADDYSDTWGYTQQTLSLDLRRIMASFSHVKLTLGDVSIDRDGGAAVITAKVRMSASGHGSVTDATNQINGLSEPFVVRWRREGWLPGKWKIVRIEQAQFDASRYGPRKRGPLMWPF